MSVRVTGFVVIRVWFVIKWGVLLLFAGEMKGEEEMGKGKRGVRPPSHNLNITDRY